MSRKQGRACGKGPRPSGACGRSRSSAVLGRKRRPRDAAEALARLKQLASELRDIQEKLFEAFRPVAKTARHAVPVWIEPLTARIATS